MVFKNETNSNFLTETLTYYNLISDFTKPILYVNRRIFYQSLRITKAVSRNVPTLLKCTFIIIINILCYLRGRRYLRLTMVNFKCHVTCLYLYNIVSSPEWYINDR